MKLDDPKTCPQVQPDNNALLKLAQATMPFEKYAGRRLVDLPEPYVVWFSRRAFPISIKGVMFEKRQHKAYFLELAFFITIGDGSVIVSS